MARNDWKWLDMTMIMTNTMIMMKNPKELLYNRGASFYESLIGMQIGRFKPLFNNFSQNNQILFVIASLIL